MNYQVQIHVLGLPATTIVSCLRCCLKEAVSCSYSYQFWPLLNRHGTFKGKMKVTNVSGWCAGAQAAVGTQF
jgi:hypothetical protein